MTGAAVGDGRGQHGVDPLRSMRDAYGASAETWAAGPALVYRALAQHLVAQAPGPLAGHLVVDLGAGTGVLSEALASAGASVVAIDVAHGMLVHDSARRPPAGVGDARALPLRAASVDGVGAAFSLTHVPDPPRALAEIRRVTRHGGCLLASSYHEDNDHPVKHAADRAAGRFGFTAPAWHAALKQGAEPAYATPEAVAELLGGAGFTAVHVTHERVDLGFDDPAAMVAWRLGMASLAPFVASLSASDRDRLVQDVLAELGDAPPYRPHVIVATARVP